jgi:hypothetical protein
MALPVAGSTWRSRDHRIAFASIEAINLWNQYCREYFLSVALGTIDAGGNPVTLASSRSFANEESAIAWATQQVARGDVYIGEPRWRTPTVWSRVMQKLGSSVQMNVTLATGLTTSAFGDLPKFRNFYAHRCRDTADKAKAVARRNFKAMTNPTDYLLDGVATTRVSILVDWIDDLYSAVDLTA